MYKNALVSCSNKEGLVEFLRPLVESGLRVVSTGGTFKHLRANGIAVVEVSEQTGFPEIMDGRVRTLHPKIHMALLARQTNDSDLEILRQHNISSFDLVVVNLYPFEQSLEDGLSGRELVEEIDIGGPAILRAAGKNYETITVVCDPSDYERVLKAARDDSLTLLRKALAAKVFAHVSVYDSLIARVLSGGSGVVSTGHFPSGGKLISQLRYGENPHQKGFWFRKPGERGLHDARILQGKELSFNNLLDIDSAVKTCKSFSAPCAAVVKHNNPCGVATHTEAYMALTRALRADPVSVFGGIVAVNRCVDIPMAEELSKIFLECVVAPEFANGALSILARKKNLRVLQWDFSIHHDREVDPWESREIEGGILVQNRDIMENQFDPHWKVLGQNLTPQLQSDLLFAWNVSQFLRSNAISIVSDGQSLGLGMGQVNRVDAVKLAIERFRSHHPMAKDVVLASDAFFPFPDAVELAAEAGIRWIIQPGGSLKDEEVFAKAHELHVTMVLTGRRHFKH